jgi:hypothetical protein
MEKLAIAAPLLQNAGNDFVHDFNIYLTLEKDYQYKSYAIASLRAAMGRLRKIAWIYVMVF